MRNTTVCHILTAEHRQEHGLTRSIAKWASCVCPQEPVVALLWIVVGLAVVGMWGASAAANFAHAMQQAGASPYAYIIGAISAGSDVLKAGVAVAIVTAFHKRLWLALVAGLLIWTATTVWSVKSGLGFISTTLSDTAASRNLSGTVDRSIEQQVEDQTLLIPQLQQAKIRAKQGEWLKFDTELAAAERKLEELRTKTEGRAATGAAEPLADLLKEHFGIADGTVRLWSAFAFLAVMELCSNLGFLAFGHMLSGVPPLLEQSQLASPTRAVAYPPQMAGWQTVQAPKAQALDGCRDGLQDKCPEGSPAAMPRTGRPRRQRTTQTLHRTVSVANKTADETPTKPPVTAGREPLRLVKTAVPDPHRFMSDCFEPSEGGAIDASEIWSTYQLWCTRQGLPTSTQTMLGRQLATLGYRKEKHGVVVYVGLRARNTQIAVAM